MGEWAAAQSTGDREAQEDDYGVFAGADEAILVLADGMGGGPIPRQGTSRPVGNAT